MCLSNVWQRLGRSALTFICIAVVVAFFAASLAYQHILDRLLLLPDVHTAAVLERAGLLTRDHDAAAQQHDQRIWLLSLSAVMCLIGITNTILMSVTERFREIGTLKCLGALDSFVVRLFLIENAFIGALASLSGALVGGLLAWLQAGAVLEFALLDSGLVLRSLSYSLPRAIGLGTALTLLAAIYPAWVASRMSPVKAMRAEV
jgi:predicted lysophospholipase L1 biosynthesis ABC-type transport system permease subunit